MTQTAHSARPPARHFVLALMMLILSACATPHREPTREARESGTMRPKPSPVPPALVSLKDMAGRHGFSSVGPSSGGRHVLVRKKQRVEIDPNSRVSYFDGTLVVLSQKPAGQGDKLMVPRSLEAHFRALEEKVVAAKPAPLPRPKVKPLPRKLLKGRHFVIDAGHGGRDHGTSRAGVREKDIVLRVARDVARLLREDGARVTMTRNSDRRIGLDRRAAISNEARPDAFISIHVNSAPSTSARGIEVYRAARRTRGQRADKLARSNSLARSIMRHLERVSPGKDRGVKKSPGFRVLRRNNHPAVLVELGFVSNRSERRLLASPAYQKKLALAVVRGIREFAASI